MIIDEVAEIGMATESLADYPELVTLPCYEWQHVLVLPNGHPLAQKRHGLDDLAQGPHHLPPLLHRPLARSTRPLRRASSRPASCWKPLTPT
jgi:DNA-binding transcriptional LysR family regulator